MTALPAEPEPERFEPMVCCRGERTSVLVGQTTGEIYAVCAGCDSMRLLHDDDQYADAQADGIAWAEQVVRDYAARLDQAGYASDWREAYLVLADVLHGGEPAVAARAAMARGFDLPADYTPGGDHGR